MPENENDQESNTPREKGKTGAKRTHAQRLHDYVLISEYAVKGYSQRETSALLNALPNRPYSLSYAQVGFDLKHVRDEWKREAVVVQDAAKAQILRTLNRQEAELWKQWERSCQDATRRSLEEAEEQAAQAEGAPRGPGRPRKKRLTSESQTGDTSIMRTILDIQREKAKLLAVYEPTKIELTGKGGAPLATTTVAMTRALSEEEFPAESVKGVLASLMEAEEKAAVLNGSAD